MSTMPLHVAENEFRPPAHAPQIVAAAADLLERKPILQQAYFTRLQDGSMQQDEFLVSQRQFYYAVRFFSRPIAALVARLPDSIMRMDLVHNLAEEQGDFRPALAHDQTFLRFLQSVGAS